MSQKKKISQVLSELDNQKQVVMNSEKYKEMGDELDDDTVVKIVDEAPKLKLGRKEIPTGEPKPKVRLARKNIPGIDEADEEGGNVDVPKLQADVQRFMDKLNLGQFEMVIKKIDKPIEKAELIAAFAERIGVPRAKLASVLASLKALGKQPDEKQVQPENTRPRMKKSDLVEHVLKNKR